MRAFREDGTEVKEGDTIVDFRGEEWTFISINRRHPFGSARVYVKRGSWKQEFFPTVFNLSIRANAFEPTSPKVDGRRVTLPPDIPSSGSDFGQGTKGG